MENELQIRLMTSGDEAMIDEFFSVMGGESRALFNRHDGNHQTALAYCRNPGDATKYFCAVEDGHMIGISSAYVSPTGSFETDVLSMSTIDTAEIDQFCYLSVSTLRSRAAWVRTEKGSTFYLTNCDDNPVSTASVFTTDTQADGMTQDEFRRMFNEALAKEQEEMANYNGESVYGASNVSETATVSDMVLPSLIFALAVTSIFITVQIFRHRKTA